MRLIDADALRSRLEYYHDHSITRTDSEYAYNKALEELDKVLPIDVETVKHGHWIYKFGYSGEPHTICSVCNCDRYGHNCFNFCMDCGAKMDE